MELRHKKVPMELLSALPEGIKYIQKKGKDYLVVEQLQCPAGHSLMDERVRLHGEPSVCIKAKIGEHEGLIFVDAFWGSHYKLYSFIPSDADRNSTTEAFCPTCNASLMVERKCVGEDCESTSAISLNLPGAGNRIVACARHGCPEHELEVQTLPDNVAQQLSEINYFGEYQDDMFGGM